MVEEIFTTEYDVALDVLAALDYYGGLMGGEQTHIETLEENRDRCSIIMGLDNGDKYELIVRQID